MNLQKNKSKSKKKKINLIKFKTNPLFKSVLKLSEVTCRLDFQCATKSYYICEFGLRFQFRLSSKHFYPLYYIIACEKNNIKQYRNILSVFKWYLMPPCLTLSIIRYGSRVK